MKRDKYELYLKSVQKPELDARHLSRRFQKLSGRPLRDLREDFCGTANLLCEFVKLNSLNKGMGIDLDQEPLDWCYAHNFKQLSFNQKNRISLYKRNVLTAHTAPVDMIVALNYSYSVFHTRKILLQYFKNVKKALRTGGVFVVDVHGGSEIPVENREIWRFNGFRYTWEVARFDPITHLILCKIHYGFPDGTQLKNAFVYDWRLWTIPELTELFESARFRNVHVLWEDTNSKTNMGNGVLRRVKKGHAEGAWYAMVVGQK
jgi:SAM-dependent methyltransferase